MRLRCTAFGLIAGLAMAVPALADWTEDYDACLESGPAAAGVEACNKALAASALTTNERAEAFRALGFHHRRLEDLSAARSALDQALALVPGNVRALRESGLVYHLVGQYAPALDDFNAALAISPSLAEVLNNRAVTHVALGNLKEAMSDLDRALELDPGSGVSWNNRANINCRNGAADDSVADRIQALYRGRFTAAAAQAGLRKSGFYDGPADGIWAEESEDALRKWTQAGCPDAPKTRLR